MYKYNKIKMWTWINFEKYAPGKRKIKDISEYISFKRRKRGTYWTYKW